MVLFLKTIKLCYMRREGGLHQRDDFPGLVHVELGLCVSVASLRSAFEKQHVITCLY